MDNTSMAKSTDERLLTILDSIDAHIYVADIETFQILFMNKPMREDFGQGLIGEICYKVFRGDSGPCSHCSNEKLLDQDGHPTGVYTWEGINPRTQRWYRNQDRAVRWTDGRFVRLQIATDITERKRAELEREQLVANLERRALQLQNVATVSQAIGSIRAPDELLTQVVHLVRERFNLYYVGLFLADERQEWVELHASTGAAGDQTIAQGRRLAVGGDSMIGQCVATGMARIARDVGPDVGREAVRFEHPLLPDTRSELALPLISRGRTIGGLTVQSVHEAAFSQEDIVTLQLMADQLANAIENARLFERTQAALQDAEATHRRYLRQAWSEYLHASRTEYYETEGLGAAPRPIVSNSNEQIGGSDSDLVTPIALRGTVIGALGVQREDKEGQWTDDEIAIIEAIAKRVAMAAENIRLLDDTQRRAAREQLVGEVATRMRETLDVETVLKTAAQEFRQALGLPEVRIRLGNAPQPAGDNDSGSSQNENQVHVAPLAAARSHLRLRAVQVASENRADGSVADDQAQSTAEEAHQ